MTVSSMTCSTIGESPLRFNMGGEGLIVPPEIFNSYIFQALPSCFDSEGIFCAEILYDLIVLFLLCEMY